MLTLRPSTHPKGKFRVPRAGLKAFEIGARTKRWRILGATLGSPAGLLAGAGSAWAAGTAGGYLLGNAGDRRSVLAVVTG